MRKFISIFCALTFALLLSGNVFGAVDGFGATGLTGGTTGKLDAIDITLDGIDNGDVASVKTQGVVYEYWYDDDNGTGEDGLLYIAPDNDNGGAYAGNGRWVLNGIRAATLQLATGTSANEVSTDGAMAGNSDDAIPTEQAIVEYIPQIIPTLIPGGVITRTKVTYASVDSITLTPGVYHHHGTAEQIVYWDATLTFNLGKLGTGGDNDDSDALTASEWHYIFIDDSALSGTVITAARLRNDTTAPTWNDAKHGWYDANNDRCIGAVLTNGSSQIIEFFQHGRKVLWADQITDRPTADLDDTWTDVTLTIPTFTTMAYVTLVSAYADGSTSCWWRTNGQTGATGHFYGAITDNARNVGNDVDVITDSNLKIEVKHATSNGDTSTVYTQGWYLPIGM